MDKKDLRIMEVLAQNCRVPNTVLGKALKISNDAINYRIKKLEESDHISQYILFLDARKLGYTRYQLFLRLQSDTDKEELYKRVSKYPFAMWINTFIGLYDLHIIVDAKNSFHLNKMIEELFVLCDHKISNYIVITHAYDLEFTNMNPVLNLGTKINKKNDHSFSQMLYTPNFAVGKEFPQYKITKDEIEIMRLLADDPRRSLTTIAEETGIDRKTVRSKILRLIQNKIIINFGAIPNLTKLGFVTYCLMVRLKQDTPENILKKPFRTLRNIFYSAKVIGDYDMLLYLNARNPAELNKTIDVFKRDLGEYVLHYDLLVMDRVVWWKQFSKGLYKSLSGHSTKS